VFLGPPPHGGIPKRILPIPRSPIKTFTGKKTKGQLVRHGDYAIIANCRTKFPPCFEGYLEFSVAFKSFMYFHSTRYIYGVTALSGPSFPSEEAPILRLLLVYIPVFLRSFIYSAISRGTSNDVLRNSCWETLLQRLSYPARHLFWCVPFNASARRFKCMCTSLG